MLLEDQVGKGDSGNAWKESFPHEVFTAAKNISVTVAALFGGGNINLQSSEDAQAGW